MTQVAFWGAVEQGLIYALLALGIMVSYRILNIADLTVEGSFTTGAAVSAVCTAAGHPVLGVLLAMCASALAGVVSGLLQTKLRIQSILAGILTMTALYSINLRIMGGRSNVSLLRMDTIFTPVDRLFDSRGKLVLIAVILLVAAVALDLFFRTQLGLSIRATGNNEEMVRSSSINSDLTKILGLGIAGALVGLSGSVIAQYQSFADVSMGVGMVVVALASLIIGEVFLGRSSVTRGIIGVSAGAVFYRLILALVLSNTIPRWVTLAAVGLAGLGLGLLMSMALFDALADRVQRLERMAMTPHLVCIAVGTLVLTPLALALVVWLDLGDAGSMKLISALVVMVTLAFPSVKDWQRVYWRRRREGAQRAAGQ